MFVAGWAIIMIISAAWVAEHTIIVWIVLLAAQIEVVEIDIVAFEIVGQAPVLVRMLIVRLPTAI